MQVQLRPETEGKVKGKRTQAHQWNTADTITSVRIAASLVLLFFSLDYTWFLIIYTITGLTDALDGWQEGQGQPAISAHGWTVLRICCFTVLPCSG